MTNITRRMALIATALAPIAARSAVLAAPVATTMPTTDIRDDIMSATDSSERFMADLLSGNRIEGQSYIFNKPLEINRPGLLNFHNCDFTWILGKQEDVIVSFEYHIAGRTDVFTEVNRFRTVVI